MPREKPPCPSKEPLNQGGQAVLPATPRRQPERCHVPVMGHSPLLLSFPFPWSSGLFPKTYLEEKQLPFPNMIHLLSALIRHV